MNPPDADALAARLGLGAADDECQLCIEAAVQYTENRRSLTDPVLLWRDPDVNLGTLQHGALLYQSKSAPVGLPEYDELATSYGVSMTGIHRLIGGPDLVVA